MVTNVTSLLKTVKAVEDEHTRGTRALESTIEAIGQEMRVLHFGDAVKSGITIEDLIRCTKAITKATAKSVAAGISGKQDDIISAANMGRKAISDMLVICKSAAYNLAETQELQNRILQAGTECAQQFRELLFAILQGSGTDAKENVPPISRRVAQSVTELVAVTELLKGSSHPDSDNFTIITENELLGAAASIDAAAKKLAGLQPRKANKAHDIEEFMDFDEMILEAAKAIAAATSALVKAASAAQRELIDSGKMSRTPVSSSDDGQWSEGLISAARLVAAATHSLVESANALVQGLASEEKLISSAKQVASSTAHLLVACKVKAEGDTEATRRLQQAGNAVIRSTDNLVRAAQKAIDVEEERSLILNKRMVGGIAQEINARSEVLRIERQLEEARGKLTAIRQAKYKLRGGDTSGDETSGYNYQQQDSFLNQNSHKSHRKDDASLGSPEKISSSERNKSNKDKSIDFEQKYMTNDDLFNTGSKFSSSFSHDNIQHSTFSKTYNSTNSKVQDKFLPFNENDSKLSYEGAIRQEPGTTDSKASEYYVTSYSTPEVFKTNSSNYEMYISESPCSYKSFFKETVYTPKEKNLVEQKHEKLHFVNTATGRNKHLAVGELKQENISETESLEQKMVKKTISKQTIEKRTISETSNQEQITKKFSL